MGRQTGYRRSQGVTSIPHAFGGGTTASLRASPPIKQPPGSSATKNRAFFHLAYSRNLPGSRPFNDWGLLRERSLGAMSTRQNGMKGSLAPSSPPPNASFPHSREQRPPGSAQAAWPHAVRRRHSETRSRRESRPLDTGLCRHYTSVYSAHRHGRKTACLGPYKIPGAFFSDRRSGSTSRSRTRNSSSPILPI